MKKDRQTTAAKAATNNGSAQGAADLEKIAQGKWARWRTTTRKGERVLIDPNGHTYHGTAQEIRDEALTPTSRRSLANSIEFVRRMAEQFTHTHEERREYVREYVREKRRDAIEKEHCFAYLQETIAVPADMYILLQAGARLLFDNFDAYLADILHGELESLLDIAERETGKREIPLTRYERAALDRIRATRPQIEAEAKARLAARATA